MYIIAYKLINVNFRLYMPCFYTILDYFVTVNKFNMSKYIIEIK